MKKIFFILLVIVQVSYSQTVTRYEVNEYTARLSKEASYKKIEASGKYPGLIAFAKDVLDNDTYAVDRRYRIRYPSSKCYATHINMDLRSKHNERFNGGAFLNSKIKEHWIVEVIKTGETAPLGCLNFGKITEYRVSDCDGADTVVTTTSQKRKKITFQEDDVSDYQTTASVKRGVDGGVYYEKQPVKKSIRSLEVDVKKVPVEENFQYKTVKYWEPITSKLFGFDWQMSPGWSLTTDLAVAGLLYTAVSTIADGELDWNFTKSNSGTRTGAFGNPSTPTGD